MLGDSTDFGFDTLLSHFGEDDKPEGAVVPPIFQNSLFLFESNEELLRAISIYPGGPPHHYSRVSNPTVSIAQAKIAALEGTEACLVTAGGMAAISNAILSVVEQGAHVIAIDTAYGPTRSFLLGYLPKFGVKTTLVDGRDPQDIFDAIRPETKLIYLETPSSLLFRMQDVAAITRVAREKGITTILDNSYSTPLHFQPAKFGVDIVVHSATKYLSGHSDVVAGAICTDAKRIDRMLRQEINLLGNILAPFGAWLLVRGMRTLSLRVKRHQDTANQVAAWLESREEVEQVHHLGLASYPQRALVDSMLSGTGGLFSFEPKSHNREKVYRFVDSLKLFGRGVSWGGFESLAIAHPVHPQDATDSRLIVRLFCGLEDPRDLLNDLAQALPHLH